MDKKKHRTAKRIVKSTVRRKQIAKVPGIALACLMIVSMFGISLSVVSAAQPDLSVYDKVTFRISLSTSAWGTTYSMGYFSWGSITNGYYQTATKNVTIPDVPEGWYYVYVIQTDTTFPTVNAFSVSPSSVTLGNTFTINYAVADTGGSGLEQVELWRANDSGGSPVNWAEVKRTYISGNSYSGSFSDAPSSTGTYWYGLHVVDGAGNWNDEKNSNTGGSPGVYGPIKRVVTGTAPNNPPNPPTTLSQLRSDGVTSIIEGGTTPEDIVVFKGTVSDPDGDQVRLEIELRQMGEAFTGEPTLETISSFVDSGTEVTITRYGFVNADYHWQYRAKDSKGDTSDWMEFGTPGNTDFTVSLPEGPYIYSINPRSGVPGDEVTITGVNFPQPSFPWEWEASVAFGNQFADIISYDAADKIDSIVCVVPQPTVRHPTDKTVEVALVSLFILNQITNPMTFAYSEPVLEALSRSWGPPGIEVRLDGENFGHEKGRVTFGNSPANSISWTNTEIVVEAPSDWGMGLESATRAFNLLSFAVTAGNATLFDLALDMLLLDFPNLYTLELDEDDTLLKQWYKIALAISVPGVTVQPTGDVEVEVTVSTVIGVSNDLPFTFKVKDMSLIDIEDSLIVHKASPGELRVYGSLGRVTGLVNGEVKEEIPNSFYNEGTVVIFSPSDSYRYEVAGTDEGTYGLTVASVENGEVSTFTAIDIPTSANAIHQYTIDWDVLSGGEEGVTMWIDSDGDGTFENIFNLLAMEEETEGEITTPRVQIFMPGLVIVESPQDLPEFVRIAERFEVRLMNVVPETPIELRIKNSKISRVWIDFREAHQNVKTTIEKLEEKPPGLPDPLGFVWAYHRIEVNVPENVIANAEIDFWVPKEWLATHGVSKENVRLLRFGEGWEELTTEIVGENTAHVSYRAGTPGFSVFAITAYAPPAEVLPLEINMMLVGALVAVAIVLMVAFVVGHRMRGGKRPKRANKAAGLHQKRHLSSNPKPTEEVSEFL